ncbi:anaerobic carbon-monoxide dehydrogenase catalytic subunit [Parasporobacterium paucivorans]|uniref:Carbon monoxide dehydrogenase n=1 Tax=Parasporobacterium paucivorans DSM 15970 TaxID=1122934 RepID=A0A1M6A8F7_9FIRM|nr:anaerobic carbon-monoxide dehydrogenase catalytic subunit [Parasporobacterium paucivorans]SHI32737.1 Ni-dependent carbon monoxide dehydrogenase precursor [Parasporobacterium paucivorans DSM 15970]
MSEEIQVMDSNTEVLLEKGKKDGADTIWDRKAAMKTPCGFGEKGICCRICAMGPCRISPTKDKGAQKGLCGATADTIVARNFARMVAAGTAAHSDHARDIAHVLYMASEDGNYKVKDAGKLMNLAKEWDIKTENRDLYDIAHEVAETALNEFGKPFGTLKFLKRAPYQRQQVWSEQKIEPRAIDREVTSLMHSTHIGCASDPDSIFELSMRTALSDGWGGSMIGTELSDILFGTPTACATQANLGVIEKNMVNILLHGHDPSFSEMMVYASEDPELVKLAKENGADGINLVGMCCTGNEITMRHGVRIAGNFYQQELAIITGAIEAAIVDVQCIFPALADLSDLYHTKFIATSPKAKITGAEYIEFVEEKALETCKGIIKEAVLNFKNRDMENVLIPDNKSHANVGYSVETIIQCLDRVVNSYTDEFNTVKPLADVIWAGVLRGAAGIVGCNNPKVRYDESHITIMKELIKNDVIVVASGCAAQAAAKAGLMTMEAKELCGRGLKEVCERVGIPPVLHMGSCVDISRILDIVSRVAKEKDLDNRDLPVVGAAPEWMSEKAVAIGTYVVASGIDTFLGITPQVTGSEYFVDLLTNRVEENVGAKFYFEENPTECARKILERIEEKREKLGI